MAKFILGVRGKHGRDFLEALWECAGRRERSVEVVRFSAPFRQVAIELKRPKAKVISVLRAVLGEETVRDLTVGRLRRSRADLAILHHTKGAPDPWDVVRRASLSHDHLLVTVTGDGNRAQEKSESTHRVFVWDPSDPNKMKRNVQDFYREEIQKSLKRG